MNKSLLIAILSLFSLPLWAAAHGTNYLEFNPDYFRTKSLNVSSAGNLYEILLPVNEFLGGMDFWFDNSGGSGTASFELRDQNNNLLTSKSVTIPHIDPVSGGQRVHVDLNSQASVVGSNVYRVKILSSMPQLRIYYADRVKFLPHNEPHISDYVNGAAEVNGEEQQFSLKFALYETTESSAPIVSNVAWTVISETQMKIDFNVNEPADYRIEYGLSGSGYTQSTNFNNDFEFCVSGVATCSLTLSVVSDSVYQYRLTVKDSWGNQSQVTGTFESGQSQAPTITPTVSASPTLTPTISVTPTGTTVPPSLTPPPVDINPPVISNLRIADITDRSVDIAWTTNEAANSHVLISNPALITITDAFDSTLELEHFLQSPGVLGPSNKYIAMVTSRDLAGNESRATISFTTLAFIPPQPTPTTSSSPTPTSAQQPAGVSGSGSGGSINIQWSTPAGGQPSNGYRVDIFDEKGNLVKTVTVMPGVNSTEIPDLKEGEYAAIVYANNDGVFQKVDKPAILNVEPPFINRLLAFWWALIPLVAGLAYMIWRNFKNKTSQIPQSPVS